MSVELAFKSEQIVPDVLDKTPKSILKVQFNEREVKLGNELTPTEVKSPPRVSWTPEENAYYTLIFTDPDAPSRANPIRREFLHWLVGNIPSNNVENGEVLAEFMGSAPPKDSDLHRYTLLLYKQKDVVKFENIKIPDTTREGRRCFSARKFAQKYNLELEAGNFYLATWDKYVEEVNKKLAGT